MSDDDGDKTDEIRERLEDDSSVDGAVDDGAILTLDEADAE